MTEKTSFRDFEHQGWSAQEVATAYHDHFSPLSTQVLSTWREVGAAGADIAITSAQISRRGQYQSHRAT